MTKAQAVIDRPVGWTVEDDERVVAAKEKWEIAGAALVPLFDQSDLSGLSAFAD